MIHADGKTALPPDGCCRYTVLYPWKESPHRGATHGKAPGLTRGKTPARHIMARGPVQCRKILPWSGENRHGHGMHQPPPAFPAWQRHQTVSPGQPDKMNVLKTRFQATQRIHGISCPDSGFYIRCDNAPIVHQLPRRLQALRQRGHATPGLERITRRHHQPHLVQPQLHQCPSSYGQVPGMRGVERPPQQADSAPAGVPPGGNAVILGARLRQCQERTCPLPMTSYRKVVSCSTPTGPRA